MSTHIYKDGSRPGERGNVIWFLLLAIALLAALTMTLSRGNDTSQQTGDAERARIEASEIMRYASGLEQTIKQMNLRGVSENAVSFENSFVSGYQNARCADEYCRLFETNGGAQSWLEPKSTWLDPAQSGQPLYGEWYITGRVCVEDVGDGGTGCDTDGELNEELVLILPWVSENLCRELNTLVGIAGDPPVENGDGWLPANDTYQGNFADGVILNMPDMRTGCFEGSGTNQPPADSYAFFHVLVEH
jgi:hypothetical protein